MPLAFRSDDYLQIGERSRAPTAVSMDGQAAHILNPGESVTVRSSVCSVGRGDEGEAAGFPNIADKHTQTLCTNTHKKRERKPHSIPFFAFVRCLTLLSTH
jgi:hypothetical protein